MIYMYLTNSKFRIIIMVLKIYKGKFIVHMSNDLIPSCMKTHVELLWNIFNLQSELLIRVGI